MPIDNNIGHSIYTASKQIGLSAIFSQHIAIVQQVLSKNKWASKKYVYIDLYAGSGINQEEKCDGSPIIFLKSIQNKLDYEAHFIENDPGNFLFLQQAAAFVNSHYEYLGDNRDWLPKILQTINTNSYGLVYADPNGLADFDMLSQITATHRFLDVLIYYPSAAAKRNGKSLDEYLKLIGKDCWIIQRPIGQWQWTFLFGTNYIDYKAWKKYGFLRLDDPCGQEIYKKLNYTNKELENIGQLSFINPSISEQVFMRSGGLCERCKNKPPSEIHHLSYKPPIEVPSNMLAVCHSCHWEIHGKLN
jgi:hypothetical protein